MKYLFSQGKGPFWKTLGILMDVLFLSLLWFPFALLVVTAIPAAIALYDAVSQCVIGNERGTYRRFFRTLWKELPRGAFLTLLWGGILLALRLLTVLLTQLAPAAAVPTYIVGLVLMAAVLCWLIPLEARYVYPFWELHGTALRFAFVSALPDTLALVAILAALVLAAYFWLPLGTFLPGGFAVLGCPLVKRALKKCLVEKEENQEDILH